MARWTVHDSAELYHIRKWGAPFFDVNEAGNVVCTPHGDDRALDLKQLIDHICRRGIEPPILIRLNDVLNARVSLLADSFAEAAKTYEFEGHYMPAYPIKVNQQRHVVEELVRCGEKHGLALEVGSKPELLVGIAHQTTGGTILCNGYKDNEYVETALLCQSLGFRVIVILDRAEELDVVLGAAERLGIEPRIGVRMKLTSRGAGKWEESSGDSSKFGLSASEVIRAIERLRDANQLHILELVHFHIGSQITAIRSVKEAIREASRVYVDLHRMGAEKLLFLDVGGGLAVDYDGSQTNFHSSKNYSVQEYANDIVSAVKDACDAAEVPPPTIVTESGRALVAHHSILVFNVLGFHERFDFSRIKEPPPPQEDDPDIVHGMFEAYRNVSRKNFQESYNDAVQLKDECATLFAHGVIDLRVRARVEETYWATLLRIQRTVRQLDYVPDDLEDLDKQLATTYFCNFSVFQSLPDSWAVGQLFPIVPLHRHEEQPTRDAIIADLTCDSDGKVDRFIDLRDVKDTLRLHTPDKDERYFLGAFLVGAYQETLGDLHNLFGDTACVHVTVDDDGYQLQHVIKGDRVDEVLTYVEYEPAVLINRVRDASEAAVRRGGFTFEQSAGFMERFERGLTGYTYLGKTQFSERRRKEDAPDAP